MKTAVSIPDGLFEAADRLARRRRMTRSALYAEALERLLAADETQHHVTDQLDAVYGEHDSSLEPAVAAAQARVLREVW